MSTDGQRDGRDGWGGWVDDELAAVAAADRWRRPRPFDTTGAVTGQLDGDQLVTFASNDYLGLTHHPAVVSAAADALRRWGTGAGASRYVVGSRPVHHQLEEALAAWRGAPAAVVLPTGYAANLAVLSTLAGPGVRVCSDALNHASIVDGCRLARAAGAEVVVVGHGDLDALDAAMQGAPGRCLVVSDLVFSMDGHAAAVEALRERCERHGALLVLDVAHAVLGPRVPPSGDDGWDGVVQVGTLSKALGSLGGFVAGPEAIVELLVQRARPAIFSTGLTPADAAAALAAVEVVVSPEGDELRDRLRAHVERLVPDHPSPIVSVVLGEEHRALAASAALRDDGLLVPAIRPPTVPPGTARLRISLSAAHTDDEVGRLASALDRHGLTSARGVPR